MTTFAILLAIFATALGLAIWLERVFGSDDSDADVEYYEANGFFPPQHHHRKEAQHDDTRA
jgi:hypothetical protein